MLDINTLKPADRELLNVALGVSPEELTKEQAGIIKARKDYLRPEQVQVFARLFDIKKPKVEAE